MIWMSGIPINSSLANQPQKSSNISVACDPSREPMNSSSCLGKRSSTTCSRSRTSCFRKKLSEIQIPQAPSCGCSWRDSSATPAQIYPQLLPAIEYVATHQSTYDADQNIYGS